MIDNHIYALKRWGHLYFDRFNKVDFIHPDKIIVKFDIYNWVDKMKEIQNEKFII